MWGKLLGVVLEKIIGGLLEMWKASKHDALNIEKGADIVTKQQLKDETEKARKAKQISNETHSNSDDDIDKWMRGPGKH